MRVRGERECQSCGTKWSYYETGSVACPNCDSLRSVGVDERTQHTDAADALDLTPARELVDEEPLHRVADAATDLAREYVHGRGFVRGGDLRDLDDRYLAALELAHAADAFGRAFQPSDDERFYFLALLRGADGGDRPDPDDVPASLREARGMAAVGAVRDYRRELRDWEGLPDERLGTVRPALERLAEHEKRIRSLQGDVDPRAADRLVAVVRDLAAAVRDGDEDALARAEDRLDRLG